MRRPWFSRPTSPRRDPAMRALCPECGHEWFEHPGAPNDYLFDVCGECDSEVEHGWRTAEPCARRLPA